MNVPRAEADYLAAVTGRLRDVLGGALVGVYPTGSVALDGYRSGRSDLDLIVVAAGPSAAELRTVAAGLDHGALPCPAAGLELVLYDRDALAGLTTEAGFALNLNTGRELPPKVETDPGHGPGFWYPIDRDITHQAGGTPAGRPLAGPAFADVCPRQPYPVLLPVVAESVAAFLAGVRAGGVVEGDNARHAASSAEGSASSVLNGCRALRFRAERTWSAKPAAARWALGHAPGFAPLIAAALDSHRRDRSAGRSVDAARAAEFLTYVRDRLHG